MIRIPCLKTAAVVMLSLRLAAAAFAEDGAVSKNVTLNECKCAELDVHCGDAEVKRACGADVTACTTIDICKLYVSEALCAKFGLSTGAYPWQKLNDHIGCDLKDLRDKVMADRLSADQAFSTIDNWSILLHEVVHACLPAEVSTKKMLSCNEWGAYQVSIKILGGTLALLCKDESIPKELYQFCGRLCVKAVELESHSRWTKCICEKIDGPHGLFADWLAKPECCRCYRQCLEEGLALPDWAPPFCSRKVYAREDYQAKVKPNAPLICSAMAFAPGGYGCREMSRGGYSLSAEDCAGL